MAVVIIAAARTPIGKFGGAFRNIPAPELGSIVIKAVLERAGCEIDQVDEVILGNVLQAGLGQGPARQAALTAGLPVSVPAMTINNICGSGLKAVNLGVAMIDSGQADVIIAGGMENMSAAPYVLPNARWGQRMGHGEMLDTMLTDALVDAFDGCHMGITAERIAEKYSITRADQDSFALASQEKAARAIAQGAFSKEIVPVSVKEKNITLVVDADEYPLPDATAESLSGLRSAFKEAGSVTAGNASGINDGAAAVLLMSEAKAKELGVLKMARVMATASTGVDPSVMGIGPVSAIQKALDAAGISLQDISLIELNEAFAAQTLMVCRELRLSPELVNVNGGAIALGHPVGASGARILVSLIHEMHKRGSRYGLASLCVGGGMGVATLLEGLRDS